MTELIASLLTVVSLGGIGVYYLVNEKRWNPKHNKIVLALAGFISLSYCVFGLLLPTWSDRDLQQAILKQRVAVKDLWDITQRLPVGSENGIKCVETLKKQMAYDPETLRVALGDDGLQALKARIDQEDQVSKLKSNLNNKIEEMNALKKEVDAKKKEFEKMRPALDRLEAAGKAYESGKRVAPTGNCTLIVTFDSEATRDDHRLAMLAAAVAMESRTDNFKTAAGTKATCRFPNLDQQYAQDNAEQFRKLGASVEIQNGASK